MSPLDEVGLADTNHGIALSGRGRNCAAVPRLQGGTDEADDHWPRSRSLGCGGTWSGSFWAGARQPARFLSHGCPGRCAGLARGLAAPSCSARERTGACRVGTTPASAAPRPGPCDRPGLKADLRSDRTTARSWIAAQPAPRGGGEWQCLTEALYFEARGETRRRALRRGRGDPQPGRQSRAIPTPSAA